MSISLFKGMLRTQADNYQLITDNYHEDIVFQVHVTHPGINYQLITDNYHENIAFQGHVTHPG